jgi:hypothetical protein
LPVAIESFVYPQANLICSAVTGTEAWSVNGYPSWQEHTYDYRWGGSSWELVESSAAIESVWCKVD